VPGLTAHFDVLPTLLDLCGIERKHTLPLDGVSLRTALQGGAVPSRTLFVHSQRVETPVLWRQSAVMTDRWRLIDGKELYDLKADPAQKTDVAADHPSEVKKLRTAYVGWWESIGTIRRECAVGDRSEGAEPCGVKRPRLARRASAVASGDDTCSHR
jgi:arylsulfatase B